MGSEHVTYTTGAIAYLISSGCLSVDLPQAVQRTHVEMTPGRVCDATSRVCRSTICVKSECMWSLTRWTVDSIIAGCTQLSLHICMCSGCAYGKSSLWGSWSSYGYVGPSLPEAKCMQPCRGHSMWQLWWQTFLHFAKKHRYKGNSHMHSWLLWLPGT